MKLPDEEEGIPDETIGGEQGVKSPLEPAQEALITEGER